MTQTTLLFIHGYSVTDLNTYGDMPQALQQAAANTTKTLRVQELYLGRYISFYDEVHLEDLARALQQAILEQVNENRFSILCHSTGGPLVRTWLHLYYRGSAAPPCPLQHLIMLAPANHGSALAQLGKSRLSRIKCWLEAVEPGQSILNWLEIGSPPAWQLNYHWIQNEAQELLNKAVFPFVLSGQSIDRKLYDHLNSYTGEDGSDGVVRLASANLNSVYLKLEQRPTHQQHSKTESELILTENKQAAETAFLVVADSSHSGKHMGILRAIKKEANSLSEQERIQQILRCLQVSQLSDYMQLCREFKQKVVLTQRKARIEQQQLAGFTKFYLHDRYSQLIFKVRDEQGHAIDDFDILLTAGEDSSADHLPEGLVADRQKCKQDPSMLSLYLNYDKLKGTEALWQGERLLRPALEGIKQLGIRVIARPETGFVRYAPCELKPSEEFMNLLVKPNTSTLIELVLHRLVSRASFRFELQGKLKPDDMNFKNTSPGTDNLTV